jgi:23S rRNA G2445 N2-methylase RlmL
MITLTQGNIAQFEPRVPPDVVITNPPDVVITNPPWGLRLTDMGHNDATISDKRHAREDRRRPSAHRKYDEYSVEDCHSAGELESDLATHDEPDALESIWRELGLFLKRTCREKKAYVLCRDASGSLRSLHLKPANKTRLRVGGIDCNLLQYDILPPKKINTDVVNTSIG